MSVWSVTESKFGDEKVSENVQFGAVYSEDPASENYSFSQATPSASLTMTITNPSAFGAFEQGKQFYLDFTPAE